MTKAKCLECGKEFVVNDIRNIPPTCGDKLCITNYKYRHKRIDPVTGRIPSPEEVRKL